MKAYFSLLRFPSVPEPTCRTRAAAASSQRAPGGPQSQREVEVLVVEEDPLVESADALERIPAVERRTAGGAERRRRVVGGLNWLAAQVVERHQGLRLGHDPGRVDQVGALVLDEDPGDHLAPSTLASIPSTKPGSASVSLLRMISGSPGTSATARLRAAPNPRLRSSRSISTSGNSSSSILAESSVEPLSTTTVRQLTVCARRLESARSQAVPRVQVWDVDGRIHERQRPIPGVSRG